MDVDKMLSEGWAGINNPDNLSPEQRERLDKEREHEIAKDAEINKAIASAFSKGAGATVLAWLKERTIDNPCFVPTLGDQCINHGLVREGQNSIYRDIVRRMEQARSA